MSWRLLAVHGFYCVNQRLNKLLNTVRKLYIVSEFAYSSNDRTADDNRVSQTRYLPGLRRIRDPETDGDGQVRCPSNHPNMFTDCL